MGEFPAAVLDALRQPLEEGVIRVRRARDRADLPARFLLVGAMNPCPCGLGSVAGACRCTDATRARYHRRLSGPLLDRFDLAVSLRRPRAEDLLGVPDGECTSTVAERVARARLEAHRRGVVGNAELPVRVLEEHCPLSKDATEALEQHLCSGALSARGLHRVWRVARTVADLEDDGPVIERKHVTEALQLRCARDSLLAGRQ